MHGGAEQKCIEGSRVKKAPSKVLSAEGAKTILVLTSSSTKLSFCLTYSVRYFCVTLLCPELLVLLVIVQILLETLSGTCNTRSAAGNNNQLGCQ